MYPFDQTHSKRWRNFRWLWVRSRNTSPLVSAKRRKKRRRECPTTTKKEKKEIIPKLRFILYLNRIWKQQPTMTPFFLTFFFLTNRNLPLKIQTIQHLSPRTSDKSTLLKSHQPVFPSLQFCQSFDNLVWTKERMSSNWVICKVVS